MEEVVSNIFISSIPVISPLTWALIMFIALRDSIGKLEKRVKTILAFYYLSVAVNWTLLAIYIYEPQWAPLVSSVTLLFFIVTATLFYHFVYLLTITDKDDTFPLWHYLIPLAIVIVLQVWSFFVPSEIQIELYKGRGVLNPDYLAYSIFFLSKPYIRVVFSFVYTLLAIYRLRKYMKSQLSIQKPEKWFSLLIALSVALLVISIIAVLVNRGTFYSSIAVIFNILIMISLHITVGYNVIRRNFLLYIPISLHEENLTTREDKEGSGKREYRRRTEVKISPDGKMIFGKLSKTTFESYFKKHKPYLDPQLKITDLLEPLRTNRSILSGFINKTYGLNFNRYINRCRLKELERLQHMPGNTGKDLGELIRKAGFANSRNYNRSLEAENPTDIINEYNK